jgi:formamidopyrimidine-DNA glycosylase
MSVELPEARILAEQMNEVLPGKQIEACHVRDYERMQNIGFMNKDIRDYEELVDGRIESVVSRGNTILVKLDNGTNLLIAPEYGGVVLYHASEEAATEKYHLKVDFTDGTVLTVRLRSMGVIQAVDDDGLEASYVYRRDFSERLSPADEGQFTLERFSELLSRRNQQLKPVLVGKDAVVVGISNSAFQDVAYRAGLHPKRRASELTGDEGRALYDAIKKLVQERIRLGGKDRFLDLYGRRGGYEPVMGPNMKQRACPRCGTTIEKMSYGGGQVYFCPGCQR